MFDSKWLSHHGTEVKICWLNRVSKKVRCPSCPCHLEHLSLTTHFLSLPTAIFCTVFGKNFFEKTILKNEFWSRQSRFNMEETRFSEMEKRGVTGRGIKNRIFGL